MDELNKKQLEEQAKQLKKLEEKNKKLKKASGPLGNLFSKK